MPRSVSWLLAAKCFTVAATPWLCRPVTIWVAIEAARYGSSERYSKLRPFWGTRLMLTAGASMMLTPRDRASLPMDAPNSRASPVSHEAASPIVAG